MSEVGHGVGLGLYADALPKMILKMDLLSSSLIG